ncbi:hypothetical protein AB0G54_18125 [Streptomyces yokosukanensis]|uniref:MmyB family transcriptional regulator n=1 Tax=Streptomyces yokosukanensis TaxID=67386 RepID=UPI0034274349
MLEAVGRALRLDPAERAHLRNLAQPGPAYVCDHLTQVPAWNALAAAVFGDFGDMPCERRAFAHLIFLDPRYRALFADSRGLTGAGATHGPGMTGA